jgi:hypothetical protein
MEPIYLPFISPRDYDTFRRILHSDLPNTYDEWFTLHTKERADRGRAGCPVREIKVNPNEFSLSFPKIISGRIGGAVQPGSEWRQWRQIVGLLDARAVLSENSIRRGFAS